MTASSLRPQPKPVAGFTLIELLVVIGIIAIGLVLLIPAVNSLTKSSGRKAAIGNLLGALEQTRVNAIKTGRSTYVVFPAFNGGSADTLNRYHCKALAIFEDDPANPAAPKQLTKWQTLPTGVAFRAKSGASGSVTDLPAAAALTPAVTFAFTPETSASAVFHCIKFNGNGEVEAPTGNTTVAVFEGHAEGTTEVVTSTIDANGEPAARESVKIGQLTGRAQRTE